MTDKDYGPWIPVNDGPPEGVTTERDERWEIKCGSERTFTFASLGVQGSSFDWSQITHIRLRADHPYYRHEWEYPGGYWSCIRCDAEFTGTPNDIPPEFGCVLKVHAGPAKKHAEMKAINIVFDGPPSHESGRFVEVEDDAGHSIQVGEWVERSGGLWALRITDTAKHALQIIRPSVDDPWTEWGGGECPIKDPAAVAECKCRNQQSYVTNRPASWGWAHADEADDILAYRVLRSSCPEDYEPPKKPVVRVEWMGRYGNNTAWWEHHVPRRGSTHDFYLRTELHDGKPVSVRLMTREEAMREVEG